MAEYIDREAVLWDLHHLWDWNSVDGITASTVLKQIITDVKNVPASDVRENIKGKWIESDEIKDIWFPMFRCSACHWLCAGISNFCPNCGADMREKKDDNN